MRKLLIAIDLQKGWRHEAATEAAMLGTVELCKKFDGDIMHCCFRNDPNSLFHKQLKWYRFVDEYDTDQIPEVAPLKLPVFWRGTYSCVNEQTRPVIEKYDMVYIAGVFTDVSVVSTALNIFDLGIPVSVVEDCVATLHGSSVHKAMLHSLDMSLGSHNIVRADEII